LRHLAKPREKVAILTKLQLAHNQESVNYAETYFKISGRERRTLIDYATLELNPFLHFRNRREMF